VAVRAAVVPHAERVRPLHRHVLEVVQGDGVPFARQAGRESAAESEGQQHPHQQQRQHYDSYGQVPRHLLQS